MPLGHTNRLRVMPLKPFVPFIGFDFFSIEKRRVRPSIIQGRSPVIERWGFGPNSF